STSSTAADIVGQGAGVSGPGSAGTWSGSNAAGGGSSQRSGNGIVDKVKERAASQLSSQKGRATEGLDTIAHAVRQTTQQLRAEDHGTVAEYIDKAAEQIERFSTRLRDKDVNELMRDARHLARRQPAMFIGGSFALGLLAARFIKSSQRNGEEEYRYEGEAGFD